MRLEKVIKNKYLLYSIFFWGMIGPFIYKISALGLCTIGTSDAIAQHYPAMSYIRRLWKECFSTLLQGKHYAFPMVDFTVGMGENTIAALNYYGLGDPFYLLTMLSSQENLPYFYSFFLYFRIFLGGIAFMAFVSQLCRDKSKAAYVVGTLVYSFTGFAVMSNAHIIFVHAMFYIPLMLLGAERTLNNRRKGLLCITVCGFALCGFYYLYIGSVSLAVYVIYRLFRQKSTFYTAAAKIGSLIAEYLLGIGLSAICFIPAVTGFFLSDRAGDHLQPKLCMSLSEIGHLLTNMFLPSYDGIQTLAVCTIGMVVLVCVIFARKKRREKVILVLLFVSAVIPYASYVMSGFGAVYDRWELVLDMYLAFLVVDVFDELGSITVIQKMALSVVFLILFVIGKKQDLFDYYQFERTFRAYTVLVFVLVLVVPGLKAAAKKVPKIGMYVLFAVAVLTVNANWKTTARDNDIEYLRERDAVAELMAGVEKESFYRIDYERAFAEPRLQMNVSMFRGYPGTMQYFSVSNPYYVHSVRKWDIAGAGFNYYGLDQRTVIETMCAVRYFVVRSEFARIVPCGFEYVKSTADGVWSLYENKNSLPIVYSYDNVFDMASYNKMNGLEKQAVMLRAAAVEEYDGALPYLVLEESGLTEGEYTISRENGEPIENGVVHVESGDILILSTQLRSECENCLLFDSPCSVEIHIEDGYTKWGIPDPPAIVNLGTTTSTVPVEVKLIFSKPSDINKENIHIVYHELSDYGQYTEARKMDTENRFEVTTNNIHGEVNLEGLRLFCFSVPYARGWYAAIDGNKTKTYLVNDLFIGIEVPEGQHEIELYYRTPGIGCGAVISLISLIILLCYFIAVLFKNGRKRVKLHSKVLKQGKSDGWNCRGGSWLANLFTDSCFNGRMMIETIITLEE